MQASAAPHQWSSFLTGRWHLSSWIAAAVTLLLLAFCNLPGQEVLDLDIHSPQFSRLRTFTRSLEHGWPLTWAKRSVFDWGKVAFKSPQFWTPWNDDPEYRLRALAMNAAAILLSTLAAGAGFELWRRRRARLWQLHLRDMLALFLVLSLAGGWYAMERQRQAHEEFVTDLPLSDPVDHSEVSSSHGFHFVAAGRRGITWLRDALGQEHFEFLDRVTRVRVDRDGLAWAAQLPRLRMVTASGDVTTSSLSHLDQLPCLEVLDLTGARFDWNAATHTATTDLLEPLVAADPRLQLPRLPSLRCLMISDQQCSGLSKLSALEMLDWSGTAIDEPLWNEIATLVKLRTIRLHDCALLGEGLPSLIQLPELDTLVLDETTIDDESVRQLAGLTRLRRLSLTNCPLTGRGLHHLASFAHLESLDLSNTRITDESIVYLVELKNLKELDLTNTAVSGRSIVHLKKLKQLRSLHLSAIAVSSEDCEPLRTELPLCIVSFSN